MGIFKTSGLPIPMVPRLHQSNCYIKRKLRVWKAQKCSALVGAETVLTSAGRKTTPFYGGQYWVWKGNVRNFGCTYQYGTAFPHKEFLYQKEATGMENLKMSSSSLWKNPTNLCRSANFPISWVVV